MTTGARGPVRFGDYRSADSSKSVSDRKALPYPSPFFDIASTYMPYSVKSLLRYCRYYFLTNPLIHTVCYKMSEYPVTEISFDTDDKSLRSRYEDLSDNILGLKRFQIEANLDYYVYGNCFISVRFPFDKYLTCQHCNRSEKAKEAKYRFSGSKFRLTCKNCGATDDAIAWDHYKKSVNEIRLVRWNPENIDIQWDDHLQTPKYYYLIPAKLKNDITMGKRQVLENIEQPYIEAVRKNMSVVFSKDGIFHLKRPTIAQVDQGWGMPLIFPVLKDIYYLLVLRKAQEAIMAQHIVPMNIVFPQASTQDPMRFMDLAQWKATMEKEIQLWRRDPNYIPILPMPVGVENIGGDGRALLLFQEQSVVSDQIINGMMVPLEFIKGGLSYAGSSVSMRMLENQFIGQRSMMRLAIQGILDHIASYMDWTRVKIDFTPFKMADDLQAKALMFQMNQANKLSTRRLLSADNIDYNKEMEEIIREKQMERQLMEKDQLAQATIQGKAQAIALSYQMAAQRKAEEQALAKQQQLQQQQTQNQQVPMDQNSQPAEQDSQEQQEDPAQAQNLAQQLVEGVKSGQITQEQLDQAIQNGQISQMVAQFIQEAQQAGQQVPNAQQSGGGQGSGKDRGQATAQQVAPGAPEGTTVYQENAQADLPSEMTSPITQATTPGLDVLHVAKRVATQIEGLPPEQRTPALERLRTGSPNLYSLVIQVMQGHTGSQGDPQSAVQMPLPTQRAPRRGPGSGLI